MRVMTWYCDEPTCQVFGTTKMRQFNRKDYCDRHYLAKLPLCVCHGKPVRPKHLTQTQLPGTVSYRHKH